MSTVYYTVLFFLLFAAAIGFANTRHARRLFLAISARQYADAHFITLYTITQSHIQLVKVYILCSKIKFIYLIIYYNLEPVNRNNSA